MALPTCANCERKIGHLEERFEYRGAKVCRECYQRLTAGEIDPPPGDEPPARAEADPPTREDDLAPIPPPSADDAALDAIIDESTGYPCAACHQHFSVGELIDTPNGWLCPACAAGKAPPKESAADEPELSFDPTALPSNEPARPRGLRAMQKKKSRLPLILLINGALAAGAVYLVLSGRLRHADQPKPPAIFSVQTSKDLDDVNAAIRQSNDLVSLKQYDPARQTLAAVRDRVQTSGDALSRERLPELQDAIGKLDGLIAGGATTRPAGAGAVAIRATPTTQSAIASTLPTESPATSPVQANAPPPATQPVAVLPSIVPPAAPPADPNDPTEMRAAAWDLLVGQSYADAFAKFQALLKVLPQDRDGELGLAICQYRFNDPSTMKSAMATIERIHADSPDTASVIGLASVTLDDNPIRSAKLLVDYLDKYNVANEVVLNALGTSLAQCEHRNLKTQAVTEFQAAYARYEAMLEQAMNNGKKRFGPKWFDADDADQKWDDYHGAIENLRKQRVNADRAAANLAQAQQLKAEAANPARRVDPKAADDALKQASDAADHAQRKLDDAKKRMDTVAKPAWPDAIPLVRPVAAVIR